jgi:dCMP deaminase
MDRPSWIYTHMTNAVIWSKRSTCPRRHVGCVIVNQFNQQIATGYNGSPRKQPHCSDVGCLIEEGHCVRVVHAEMNAILQLASLEGGARGSHLFVNTYPCIRCATAIVQSGITSVVFEGNYGSNGNYDMVCHLFDAAQIKFYKWLGFETLYDILLKEEINEQQYDWSYGSY